MAEDNGPEPLRGWPGHSDVRRATNLMATVGWEQR